eukprot:1175401-Prorocentrum_minimum.AAC.3
MTTPDKSTESTNIPGAADPDGPVLVMAPDAEVSEGEREEGGLGRTVRPRPPPFALKVALDDDDDEYYSAGEEDK